MSLFDSIIDFLTEGGKKQGIRLWKGKSGTYIKQGGNGRKGKTLFFKKK